MAVPFSNTKLRVPRGFQSLLEGFAREVLRSQPKDIYTFGAMYFDELVRRREETGDDDPAQLAAKVEDRFYNNNSFQQPAIDPSDPQQQEASVKIQTSFRKHAAEKEAAKRREDKAASEIQSAVRGHQEREAAKDLVDDEKKDAEKQDEDIIDLDDPEVAAAAIKIQAGFKGYRTRKDFVQHRNQVAVQEEKQGENEQQQQQQQGLPEGVEDSEEAQNAAVKIQAGFKGYKVRKEINEMRKQQHEDQEEQPQEENEQQQQGLPEGVEDSEEAQNAAVKIQAGFKGYKVRKEVNEMRKKKADEGEEGQQQEEAASPAAAAAEEQKADGGDQPAESKSEAVDIDLNDPEVEQAASKIQAGFKGYKARQQLEQQQQQQQQQQQEQASDQQKPDDEIDPNDPEQQKAALKIQAGYRGMKTRKEVSEMKQQKQADSAEPEDEGDKNNDDAPAAENENNNEDNQ